LRLSSCKEAAGEGAHDKRSDRTLVSVHPIVGYLVSRRVSGITMSATRHTVRRKVATCLMSAGTSGK